MIHGTIQTQINELFVFHHLSNEVPWGPLFFFFLNRHCYIVIEETASSRGNLIFVFVVDNEWGLDQSDPLKLK